MLLCWEAVAYPVATSIFLVTSISDFLYFMGIVIGLGVVKWMLRIWEDFRFLSECWYTGIAINGTGSDCAAACLPSGELSYASSLAANGSSWVW